MEPTNWASEHSDALRELLAQRLPFSRIAAVINKRFNTAYSRNAALGRATRMGLVGPDRPGLSPCVEPRLDRLGGQVRLAGPTPPRFHWPLPPVQAGEPVKLRCVETVPRHLSLLELECGDCRYPYGGDREGEAITFCGHPRRPGSSYCTPHFHLSRGPGTASERSACAVLLRLVETERTVAPGSKRYLGEFERRADPNPGRYRKEGIQYAES
jgi:GcrA cell cycle regulator